MVAMMVVGMVVVVLDCGRCSRLIWVFVKLD